MEQNMVIIIPFDSREYVYLGYRELLDDMINSLLGEHWYKNNMSYAREELRKIVSQRVNSQLSYDKQVQLITRDFYILYRALFPALGMLYNKELPIVISWRSAGPSTYIFVEIDEGIWSTSNDYGYTTL